MTFKEDVIHSLETTDTENGTYYAFSSKLEWLTDDVNEKLDVDKLLTQLIIPQIRIRFDREFNQDITKLEDFRIRNNEDMYYIIFKA